MAVISTRQFNFVVGSFTSYATRFIEDAYGFALSWNYWLNDAVSVASDLTAAQLILEFWSVKVSGWIISLTILLTLLLANAIHVKVYGELGMWNRLRALHRLIVEDRILAILNQDRNGHGVHHRRDPRRRWTES